MKIAWITGGGTGIGRALAEALCADGYRVAISGRRLEPLHETARQIESANKRAEILPFPGDISDPVSLQAIYTALSQRWGNPDLLINNAGQNPSHPFRDVSIEEYQHCWNVNCLAAIRCTEAVLPGMREKGYGAIVNISSIYGKWASENSAPYSVSKYALTGYTDVLRQAMKGTGIHVMGVFPGYIQTPMTQPFVQPGSRKSRFGKSPASLAQAILRGLQARKAEVCYPWYVTWSWRFHRWWPSLADAMALRFRRG